MLVKLARSSAGAIANAIDYERERRIARALTLGFVPESLPEVPGLRDRPPLRPRGERADGRRRVRGLAGGRGESVAVLVGDVAGKGVETAALSAMVRFFVEARSWDTLSPAKVLEQANAMLLGRLPRDTFVTAFLGFLSRDSLRYCNAGHLPPLHVSERHRLPARQPRSAARRVRAPRLLGERAASRARRPGLRPHRWADRGAPGGRDVRHRAPVPARGGIGRARTRPQELVRAVHEDVTGWADGISDDAVALALRRTA